MKRIFSTFLISLAIVLGVATVAPAASVGAINVFKNCDDPDASKTEVCKAKKDDKINTVIQNVIKLLLWAIGLISVIMIIIGGIRYTMSNGDPKMVTAAKDTVMYAVVGLVVAMLAYAIVDFVIGRF